MGFTEQNSNFPSSLLESQWGAQLTGGADLDDVLPKRRVWCAGVLTVLRLYMDVHAAAAATWKEHIEKQSRAFEKPRSISAALKPLQGQERRFLPWLPQCWHLQLPALTVPIRTAKWKCSQSFESAFGNTLCTQSG